MLSDTVLFTGNANPVLAQEIGANLGLTLGKAKVGHFSDGEVDIEIGSSTDTVIDEHDDARARLPKPVGRCW